MADCFVGRSAVTPTLGTPTAVSLLDVTPIWVVFGLSFWNGLLNAAEVPTRASLIGELVPDEDIPNAVALMMSAFNLARIAGPAAAGLLVATAGYGTTFFGSALAALMAMAALLLMRQERAIATRAEGYPPLLASLTGGVKYSFGTPAIFSGFAVLATMAVFGISFQTIAPIYALELLKMDTSEYGLLIASMGIGALVAALGMTVVTLPRARILMFAAPIGFGLVLALLTLVEGNLAYPLVGMLGFCYLLTNSSVNVTTQASVSHAVRGRVMGLYVALAHGGTAIGGLVMGVLVELASVEAAMLIGSVGTVAVSAILGYRWVTRPTPGQV